MANNQMPMEEPRLKPWLKRKILAAWGLPLCVGGIAVASRLYIAAAPLRQDSFFGNVLKVYMPRHMCMFEEAPLIWLHVISDSVIALAYFSIPLALVKLVHSRRDLRFNWIFVSFAVFILACGLTHVLSVIAIWNPVYRLDGLIKAVTAIASVITAVILWPLTPKVIALPSMDALRASEAKFRRLLETAPDAMVIVDALGKIELVNAQAEAMFGYPANEMLGQPIELLIPARHQGDHVAKRDAYLSAPAVRGMGVGLDLFGLRKDQTEFPVEISLSPMQLPDGLKVSSAIRDISGRKREENTLKSTIESLRNRTAELEVSGERLFASENRYRSLVKTAKEYAIVTLDTQGRVTTWNAGAERIKGYTEAEILGQHFSRFYTAEDAHKRKPQMQLTEALAAGQHEDNGWRVRQDGTLFWANVVITTMRDSHGEHVGFSKIVRDLSLRRQAEEKLRTSEEWLRALVEGGKKYAIITLDALGCVTTWNAGAQRIKGYRADEVMGQPISLFYTPDDVQRGKPQQQLKVATETGQYEEDAWRVRKDGTRFWANVLISVLRDSHGKHLGFSKITRDLTDIMRAEEQARNFFMLSLELLCIAGVDGYFKILNPAWENTLGYTQAELCAKPFLDFVHPDDLPASHAAVRRITTSQPLDYFENRYRCKDGSYRWLLWKIALSTDSQLMHCAAADITQIKKTEAEIAGLNKSLQLQNLELATANKELEAFSYSVSHDLRAPLRSIDGFSKAILEDYKDTLDSTGQDYLQRVRSSSQRMGQLIDDMLNLSRVSRGDLLHEPTDLSQIAREVINECRASSTNRKVRVQITDGLIADADPRLMRIVLTNLLGNAWKFTGKTAKALIEFECSEKGEYFVRDNGAGFDMAFVDKLFGAFQRLHSDKDFPGTGIGLATIQRIIHRHGGIVRAQSKPGEGATFYFTLKQQSQVKMPALQTAT